jgi:hypothetical protein
MPNRLDRSASVPFGFWCILSAAWLDALQLGRESDVVGSRHIDQGFTLQSDGPLIGQWVHSTDQTNRTCGVFPSEVLLRR